MTDKIEEMAREYAAEKWSAPENGHYKVYCQNDFRAGYLAGAADQRERDAKTAHDILFHDQPMLAKQIASAIRGDQS